ITWAQFWARAQQLNPGTEVVGQDDDWAMDFLIRRARFLTFSQLNPDVLIMFHVGINNQNFRDFRSDFYVHDAWVEYRLVNQDFLTMYMGGGIHYWNGVSRQANASTLNFLAIDAPISNWPLIEFTDQFARQIGIYVKGKVAKRLEYRMAVNRPFNRGAGGGRNPTMNTFSVAGYYSLQLWDIESDKLPYTVGTYLGSKKVLNFGAGFHFHPEALSTRMVRSPTSSSRAATSSWTSPSASGRTRRRRLSRPMSRTSI
ncbi:MAG: hypothetical protein HC923_07955, partial [Myxococcales bacterium]|nr:hypothetical protein [Myxococcales bacterium]